MNTKKLEKLLLKVSKEINILTEQGYEVNIQLPNHILKECQLKVYKPIIIAKHPCVTVEGISNLSGESKYNTAESVING